MYLNYCYCFFLIFFALAPCVAQEQNQEESFETKVESIAKEVLGEDRSDKDISGSVLSLEAERRISAQIRRLAQEFRVQELDFGFRSSCSLGYASQGIDVVLPEYFFRGHLVYQDVSVYKTYHKGGMYFTASNSTSVDGGPFNDAGDRTTLSCAAWRKFGFLYGLIRHRWVHTNYSDRPFLYADRHRTDLRSWCVIGPLRPYAFISSDFPALVPVDEMVLFGGVGADLHYTVKHLRTDLYLGASVAGSLLWHNHNPRSLYRLRAGFAVQFGKVYIGPEFIFLKDVYNPDNVWVTSFGIRF